MHSALYLGRVRHRRFTPRPHAFSYPLFMVYLDLDELDRVFASRWLWSIGRANVASFKRADYFGDPAKPLKAALGELVQSATGHTPTGPIRLLTHLRYFGHCFNPVTFYYCFNTGDTAVETIVAEITNTPWKERHCYVLPVGAQSGAISRWQFDKCFHVSPFMPMDLQYDWRCSAPGEALAVHMNCQRDGRNVFDASLSLQRRELGAASMALALLRFPLITVRVLAAIHWQAFRLWLKRVPVVTHPARVGRFSE
jgi:DUF1365 family protein